MTGGIGVWGMKLHDVKTVLKEMIAKKTAVTPMLWGSHGVGKSSVISQVAKDVGYKVFKLILSQKEAVDVAGVLYTYEDPTLNMSVTAAHPPVWFAEALKNGNCILFLDEFNMARREVLNASFEIVLDRCLNNMKLPDSVFVVCAGNPDDERYDVTPLSESLRDRLMHLKVESDVKSWVNWAETSKQIHCDVINFIKTAPQAIRAADERDNTFPVDIKHSERSWERVGAIHQLSLPIRLKLECYRGIVGLELAQAFVKTLDRTNLPIESTEILAGNQNELSRAIRFATVSPLRVDLLVQTFENLMIHLEDHKAQPDEMTNTLKFVEVLPTDLASKVLAELVQVSGWLNAVVKSKVASDLQSDIAKIKSVSKKRA
jgi:hypothetical protein